MSDIDMFLHFSWIYSTLPSSKQMLALSATYTDHLAQHLRNYMKDPTFVRLNTEDLALEGALFFTYCPNVLLAAIFLSRCVL